MTGRRFPGPVWRGLFLFCAWLGMAGPARPAAMMTELRYQDQDPGDVPYASRILMRGDRLRMDYGRDAEDFILFDRRVNTLWLVSHGERRVTEISGGANVKYAWPEDWRLELTHQQTHQPSGAEALYQLRVNGQLCAEYRVAPILKAEARRLAEFRRALAANQYEAWRATPVELRQACGLALDVREAGVEYRDGLPLALRYWDGRTRVYQGHELLPARPGLFELPQDYSRFTVGGQAQGKARARQPAASQAR